MRILHVVIASALAGVVSATPHASAQTPAKPASGAAHKVDLSKYPAPVRATIEAETKNATLKGVSRETEKGRTQYEVETVVAGKTRDLLVDPSGKVLEVEEEIAPTDAPPAVQSALKTHGTVVKIERVLRGSETSFEAQVKDKTGKKAAVALDADGKPIKG